jgi:hypothetical protein
VQHALIQTAKPEAGVDALALLEPSNAKTVTVEVADQTQLHGILAGLRDIGAVLTELRTTGPPDLAAGSVLERSSPRVTISAGNMSVSPRRTCAVITRDVAG